MNEHCRERLVYHHHLQVDGHLLGDYADPSEIERYGKPIQVIDGWHT